MGLYTAGQCEHDPARALAQIYADPAGATPVVQPLCSDAWLGSPLEMLRHSCGKLNLC
jgi:hypothetical protein